MRFFHLSDLHLGKRLNDYSLLEDQRHILAEILALVDRERPQAVLIAGDIYDKAVPSAEAVSLFDWFLVELSRRGTQALVISGNHDSAERLAFGGRLMEESGVQLSPVYNGRLRVVTLEDAWGPVHFYLMPFIKPATVRSFFEETPPATCTEAVQCVLGAMAPDFAARNVLVAHQFVTGAAPGSAGDSVVGGLDNVEAAALAGFDYVALGHIHGAQSVGEARLRYCGSPLKYSLSELGGSRQTLSSGAELSCGAEKSVTLVELGEKGSLSLRTLPLKPLHEVWQLRGSYEQVMQRATYFETGLAEDYVYITLTDEQDVPNAIGRLRTVYQRLLGMKYDNARSRSQGSFAPGAELQRQSPLELFARLYRQGNGQALSAEQSDFLSVLIATLWEENA